MTHTGTTCSFVIQVAASIIKINGTNRSDYNTGKKKTKIDTKTPTLKNCICFIFVIANT